MSHILLTGRLPELSIAELEALYGARSVSRIGDHALVDADVDFARLGGSIKMADHLATVDSVNPQKVFDYCRKSLPEFVSEFPDGKIKLGVSLYGLSMPLFKQNANALSLKKVLKNAGRSVRVVPNTEAALTSAQTYHNSMTTDVGLELVFVSDGNKTYVGRVTDVQNIDSYTVRDRGRPKRDAFVGMLPPKLAQTIINIAVGPVSAGMQTEMRPADGVAVEDSRVEAAEPQISRIVLDPFCGTGVVLQEAALMGYDVYGTDISEKMVRFSRDNINWAIEKFDLHVEKQLEIGDATTHKWRMPILAVAGEGYLGQPLGGQDPTPEKLAEIMHDCQAIMRGFLKNLADQVPAGTRVCIAAPAWFVRGTLHTLPVTESIEETGFSWIPFTHVDGQSLVYSREDQVTHRYLLPLVRQ